MDSQCGGSCIDSKNESEICCIVCAGSWSNLCNRILGFSARIDSTSRIGFHNRQCFGREPWQSIGERGIAGQRIVTNRLSKRLPKRYSDCGVALLRRSFDIVKSNEDGKHHAAVSGRYVQRIGGESNRRCRGQCHDSSRKNCERANYSLLHALPSIVYRSGLAGLCGRAPDNANPGCFRCHAEHRRLLLRCRASPAVGSKPEL